VGLAISVVTDLPSSPVIVWTMALLGLVVHLMGNHRASASAPER
jgi:ABC-type Mn2+/Zn2+ transport system permease subunit